MAAWNIATEQSRQTESVSVNPDLAEIMVKVVDGLELNRVEQLRWGMHIGRTAAMYAGIEEAYRNGQLDDGFYADSRRKVNAFASMNPAIKEQLQFTVRMMHPSLGVGGIFGDVLAEDSAP